MADRPYRGLAMEGPIARWYARNTRAESRGFPRYADAIAERVPPGARVLEVAPGPGYLAIELARRGLRVTGLDISRTFVELAAEEARRAGVAVDFRLGNASAMPFADESFDFVVCMAAFKNFRDPVGALDEVHRVLAPGGAASIFDLRKDAPRDAIRAEVDGMGLGWLDRQLTHLTFRFVLLRTAYTRPALEALVARSRAGRGDILDDGIGFDLRLAKPADQSSSAPTSG